MVETKTRQTSARCLGALPGAMVWLNLAGSFNHEQSTGYAGSGRRFPSALRGSWAIAASAGGGQACHIRGRRIRRRAGRLPAHAPQGGNTVTPTYCVWSVGWQRPSERQLSAHGFASNRHLCPSTARKQQGAASASHWQRGKGRVATGGRLADHHADSSRGLCSGSACCVFESVGDGSWDSRLPRVRVDSRIAAVGPCSHRPADAPAVSRASQYCRANPRIH